MNRSERRRSNRHGQGRKFAVGSLALGGLVASNLAGAAPAYALDTTVGCDKDALTTAVDSGTFSKITVSFPGATCLIDLGAGGGSAGLNINGQTLEISGPTDKALTIKASTSGQVFALPQGSHFTLKNATIQGLGNTGSTAISFDGGTASSLTIDRVTFDDHANDHVIYDNGGGGQHTITISNSTFSNNSAGWMGAAIYAEGALTISDSVFANNRSDIFGGAIAGTTTSVISITGSTFTGNAAEISGGAIWSEGTLTVSDSTFSGNSASSSDPSRGGAIMIARNSLPTNITNSTFASNSVGTESTSGMGGAIYALLTDVNVSGSTFSNNTASTTGGAIVNEAGLQEINNSTFVDNSATYAGAVYTEGGLVENSTFFNNSTTDPVSYVLDGQMWLFGNILATSSASQKLVSPSMITDLAYNLTTDESLTLGVDTGSQHNVTLAQLNLKPLALYSKSPSNTGTTKTVALGENSIARDYYTALPINYGPASVDPNSIQPQQILNPIPTVDQRGVSRPLNSAYDVGAYEGPAPVICAPGTLGTIKFGPNSSRLTTKTKKQLRNYVNSVVASGCTSLTIKGYTATSGSKSKHAHNIRVALSKARAKAVKKYLGSKLQAAGVTATFEIKVYGKKNPVGSNKSEKGKKLNRRVVIVLNAIAD